MLKVCRVNIFYDSLESFFHKIKATPPPESMKYLKKVEQTLHLGVKPRKEYGKFREILNQVNDAALHKKTLEIVYYSMSRKKETRRRLESYKIWFFNGTFYLIGH